MDVFFKYNPNITDRTSVELQNVVRDVISDYNFNNLNKFDGVFRHSQILKLIDSADPSILNSTIRPYMYKNIVAGTTDTDNVFNISFASPLYESGDSSNFLISSTAFKISTGGADHFFGDIPITGSNNRQVMIYKVVDGKNITVINNAGTIIPSSGKVSLNNFTTSSSNTSIRITAIPNSLDIAPKRDQLINIDQAFVSITAQVDTISTAGSSGSIDYSVNSRLR